MSLFLPSFMCNYFSNMLLAAVKSYSDFALLYSRSKHFPHFSNNLPSELGVIRFFAARKSFFRQTISHIVLLSSRKQMGWIYTGRIVAFVKNSMSVWNRSIVNQPRRSVGKVSFVVSSVNNPVSLVVNNTDPKPARFGFFNFAPKSFSEVVIESLRKRWVLGNVFVWHGQLILRFIDCATAPAANTARGYFNNLNYLKGVQA